MDLSRLSENSQLINLQIVSTRLVLRRKVKAQNTRRGGQLVSFQRISKEKFSFSRSFLSFFFFRFLHNFLVSIDFSFYIFLIVNFLLIFIYFCLFLRLFIL